jgi:hypothetical protein
MCCVLFVEIPQINLFEVAVCKFMQWPSHVAPRGHNVLVDAYSKDTVIVRNVVWVTGHNIRRTN